MAPDHDLSNLETSQADLWIYLQFDAIFGQIMANQAERLGFPLALGDCIVSAVTESHWRYSTMENGERTAGPASESKIRRTRSCL
jgi:hypothetical protein